MTRLYGLPASTLAKELATNLAMGVPAIRRLRAQGRRTGHSELQAESAKIAAQFDFFANSLGDLRGLTVMEIGPGDALGLAPLLLARGAAHYLCIDRFLGDVWGERSEALYADLATRYGAFAPNWREAVTLHRVSVEQAAALKLQADLIISFDVLEHVSDMASTVQALASMLRPGGRMVHRVDYGPHGVWLNSPNPLDFLRVPQALWHLMGSNRGLPNRVRHTTLVQLLEQAGLQVDARVTRQHQHDVLDAELCAAAGAVPALGPAFVQPRGSAA